MESMGVVVRRYIDFLILLIPTPLVSVLFAVYSIPTFCSFKKMFFVLYTLCLLFSWLHILHCTVVITLRNLASFPSYSCLLYMIL